MRVRPAAVLFDLDGTVIDSAPDLAAAANQLRLEHGLAALPYAQLRPMVGSGARGMVGTALGVVPGDARFEPLRDRFLALYEAGLLVQTQVFEHMVPVLDRLDAAGIPWGIVTNKAERFALPVIRGLGLDKRAGAVVCGDTTARAKPHPDPLLEAARRMQVAPAHCHYVGDDLRDIEAGQAAGMGTLAAAWGYLGAGEAIEDWGADLVLNVPNELLNWLELA
jgi:N-acetyl-D-muramate 6-phosphate phosphatase